MMNRFDRPAAPRVITTPSFRNETVAEFLARGGRVTVGAAKVAKGASLVRVVKSGTTRVAVSRG